MKEKIPAAIKKEISRLRSEVRNVSQAMAVKPQRNATPFSGVVSGNYNKES